MVEKIVIADKNCFTGKNYFYQDGFLDGKSRCLYRVEKLANPDVVAGQCA